MKISAVSLSTLCLILPGSVPGASIAVDFGVYFQSTMNPSENAGYVPQQNWNSFPGAFGSQSNLMDDSGLPTTTSVSWTSNNLYQVQDGQTDTPGNRRMMYGYLDTSNTSTTTVTVTNIPNSYVLTGYTVFVYLDGSNGADHRTGRYSLLPTGGTAITRYARDAANTYFNGTFIESTDSTAPILMAGATAANFVRFSDLTSTGFNLTAAGSVGEGFSRAPVNGIQIVQIPEPSSLMLLNLGLLGLARLRRRLS